MYSLKRYMDSMTHFTLISLFFFSNCYIFRCCCCRHPTAVTLSQLATLTKATCWYLRVVLIRPIIVGLELVGPESFFFHQHRTSWCTSILIAMISSIRGIYVIVPGPSLQTRHDIELRSIKNMTRRAVYLFESG